MSSSRMVETRRSWSRKSGRGVTVPLLQSTARVADMGEDGPEVRSELVVLNVIL